MHLWGFQTKAAAQFAGEMVGIGAIRECSEFRNHHRLGCPFVARLMTVWSLHPKRQTLWEGESHGFISSSSN